MFCRNLDCREAGGTLPTLTTSTLSIHSGHGLEVADGEYGYGSLRLLAEQLASSMLASEVLRHQPFRRSSQCSRTTVVPGRLRRLPEPFDRQEPRYWYISSHQRRSPLSAASRLHHLRDCDSPGFSNPDPRHDSS